jgi:protein SCO1/2
VNNTTLPYWLALMVAFAGMYGAWKWYQVEQAGSTGGILIDHMPPLEEFELTERSGDPFRSAEMRGKVWVVTFFFSQCAGSCPRLNSSIRHMNSLEEIQDVTWVSITVDPEQDTLPVLQEYADRFSADPQRWLFCRGDLGYVNRIGRDFLKVDDVSLRGHRDYATVIDRSGKVRGVFDATSRAQSERMVELLKELLAEAPPAEPPAAAHGASSAPAEASPAPPMAEAA